MQGTSISEVIEIKDPTGRYTAQDYELKATIDANNDGMPDLALVNTVGLPGAVTIWYIAGTGFDQFYWMQPPLTISPGWDLRATADYNDDGNWDVLITHADINLLDAGAPDAGVSSNLFVSCARSGSSSRQVFEFTDRAGNVTSLGAGWEIIAQN